MSIYFQVFLSFDKKQTELNKTKFIDLLIIQIRAIIKQQKLGCYDCSGKSLQIVQIKLNI
jgi:hypothetical protein